MKLHKGGIKDNIIHVRLTYEYKERDTLRSKFVCKIKTQIIRKNEKSNNRLLKLYAKTNMAT